jgi:hypothetical protein
MGSAMKGSVEGRRLTLQSMGTIRAPFETDTIVLTLADGTTISLPGYPRDMAVAIETMGNNGATEHMAGLIHALAEKLLSEGEIDEAQYEAIKALATQGERMAKQMKIAEDAFAQYKIHDIGYRDPLKSQSQNLALHNKRAVQTRKIQVQDVDGNWMSLRKLVQTVGFYGPSPYQLSPTQTPGKHLAKPGKELATFLSLYKATDQSKAMKDPAVAKLMSHLVGEIVGMGEYVESTVSAQETAHAVRVTRENSDTICTVGHGDLSNGVQCI